MKIRSFKQLSDDRLDKTYFVYELINFENKKFILKQTPEKEVIINKILETNYPNNSYPKIINHSIDSNHHYLTFEYVNGEDLSILTKNSAENLAISIAKLVNFFSKNSHLLLEIQPNFTTQKKNKQAILKKLPIDSDLQKAYILYLDRYSIIPQSICHDDLLPINIIFDNELQQVKILDWEHTRINSYISDISRFGTFFSNEETSFNKGFSFLDKNNYVDYFLQTVYQNLSQELKNIVTEKQFYLDYHLESFHQILTFINYLPEITLENINNDWEHYFYKKTCEKSSFIIKELKK